MNVIKFKPPRRRRSNNYETQIKRLRIWRHVWAMRSCSPGALNNAAFPVTGLGCWFATAPDLISTRSSRFARQG